MKIEVQDKPVGIPFPQIEFGRVFKWENGYYLRCDDEESMHNAVSLTTNVLCFFTESDYVEPVNAKVVISE